MSDTLLIELGTEELPPAALRSLAEAFAAGIAAGLREAGLPAGQAKALGTPRRLAVQIADVATKAPDREEQRLGPAVDAAFDDAGQPTKAAEGFARSCGVAVADLERHDTDKGPRLAYRGTAVGQSLSALLFDVCNNALKRLPIPKRMRWGDFDETFVRPVHWVTVLHGATVLPLELFGCQAGRETRGHRFHHPGPIALEHADQYPAQLEQPGYVIADLDRRREMVETHVRAVARQAGGEALCDPDLVDEVAALVEWPVALAGTFEARYLVLPREVLVATLEDHQRYFPVADASGELVARFITVANIESREPARVIAGNERVIRPRLADALFFWERDQARGLDALATGLQRVTFQRDLGSLADKSARVAGIADQLTTSIAADARSVARACALAKADLLTEMVDEFPQLQGTMGCYYARAAGENEAVALALDEQYAPRRARAPIATNDPGRILAIADRLDTLAGVFGIGGRPSGEKDPFALRRAALGVLRTCIEAELDLDLRQHLAHAIELQPIEADRDVMLEELLTFHVDRLRAYYADQGIEAAIFDAVASTGLARPLDWERRLQAVRRFVEIPAASQLCSAHKRIRNILKDGAPEAEITPALFTEPAETALHDTLGSLQAEVTDYAAEGDYSAALSRLATLQEPVDRFFDEVLVMSQEPELKQNRLALMRELDKACRSVADISQLNPLEQAAA